MNAKIESLKQSAANAGDATTVALCALAQGYTRAELPEHVREACPPRIRQAGARRMCLAAMEGGR